MTTQYFLTLTLNPMLYTLKPEEQLKLSEDVMFKYFQPETYVKELTKLGNIHYHLMFTSGSNKIEMHKIIKEFIRNNFKIFGNIYDLKQIRNEYDHTNYINYMSKNPYKPIESVD